MAVLIAAAAVFGVYEAGASGRDERQTVNRYAAEWRHGHYAAMYRLLSPGSRHKLTEAQFATKLSDAEQTATAEKFVPGKIQSLSGNVAKVSFTVHTRVFGLLHQKLEMNLTGSGGNATVRFGPSLLFPGLQGRQLLTRTAKLGKRGTLLASNGQVLAAGSSLSTPIPEAADQIVGTLGPIPAGEQALYMREGYPPHAKVGQDGLESVFQKQLAGTAGGKLLAGKRVLATAAPINGGAVKTTIDPTLEEDAADALGNHYAGITIMDPRTGAVEAADGIAYTDVQPPGSTFKIITATAALEHGQTTLTTEYPMLASKYIDGFNLQNAAGEVCGGTLLNAFATSCDTTFAPIGITVGAKRLVSTAEQFGFNKPIAAIPTAFTSTIPAANKIGDSLAVGDSAIGQGKVQASTLEMADVAATIADHGRRPLPTMAAGATPKFVKVTTPKVAGEVQTMMLAVVDQYDGTGTAAQIPGVEVAGKTGTAELADTNGKKNDAKETDAWFVAYAPANDPKVVVCALFPNAGYGGDTAAPTVREVIEEALGVG